MSTPPKFVPGLELSRRLYSQAVAPILNEYHPELDYAAGLLGSGSEVLGLDTARSTDHDWGPRLQLFVPPGTGTRERTALSELLSQRLPKTVEGWSTHFEERPDIHGPSGFAETTDGPVHHRVRIVDLPAWLAGQLGTDTPPAQFTATDWLAIPAQRLAEATAGAVFHDGPGDLTAVRDQLRWYPEQVWRYLLACQWMKLSQEEAFVGRGAEVGDDLGSAVVAARQVRELMRLALLLARRYPPYSKWIGSVFTSEVPDSHKLGQTLRSALAATSYTEREEHLCDAYEELARRQNALGMTGAPVDPRRRPYHSRPFQVLHADRFAHALRDTVTDPDLAGLPLVGGVDQWADSTDFLARSSAIQAAVRTLRQTGD